MQETLVWSLGQEDPLEKRYYSWASLVAQLVKNPPVLQETWVQSVGYEDPLEKGKATHSSILAWRIPWLYSPWGRRVRHDWATFTHSSFERGAPGGAEYPQEYDRNGDSQTLLNHNDRNSQKGTQQSILTSPPGDSDTGSHWRISASANICFSTPPPTSLAFY